MEKRLAMLGWVRAVSGAIVVAALLLLAPAAFAGGPPVTSINPPSWDYGTIDSGSSSLKTFVVTNTGGSATAVMTVSLSGSPAFAKTADTCAAASIGPNHSCSITVRYSPTTDGSTDSGTLTVTGKKSGSIAASLAGKSTVPVPPAASVSPNPDLIASASTGTPVARTYTIANLHGAFTGRAVGTTLGSARLSTPTIGDGAQQQYVVTVASGSTSLRATIGSSSDPAADLDLYLYNCTTGSCVLARQSAGPSAEESVSVDNPAAGIWVVLVDGFTVPSGSTTYHELDVFTNPAFGSISINDANALRPASSSWTAPGSVTVGTGPAAGRVLLGQVEVRTSTNVLIGAGDVIVQSVSA